REQRPFGRIVVLVGHTLHGQIESPVVEIPAAPEPAQILAGLALHRPEEVRWRGMMEGPVANEAAESPVETLRPENLLAQQDESQGGLEVCQWMPIFLKNGIRTGHDDR